MTLGEQIKSQRKNAGLTQEELAEKLGVSRQTVTKWEKDQSAPTADKLFALATLFETPIDELMSLKVKATKRNNNYCLAAIIMQLGALCSCTYISYSELDGLTFEDPAIVYCKLAVLLFASVWMTVNIFREIDIRQRAKNAQIELIYCVIQAIIAFCGRIFDYTVFSVALLFFVCMLYVFIVNPKIMKRMLVTKSTPCTGK